MTYYFDHNATTPVMPEVIEAWAETQRACYGNPSSVHAAGQAAQRALDAARAGVARFLGCEPKEIVFTGSGTEADNLALCGVLRARPGHLITTAIEHPAVLKTADQFEAVTVVPVNGQGVVEVDAVRRALRPDTRLISVMHANDDTGAVQPVQELAALAHGARALFHSDGVQAAGKLAVNVRELGVDLYSISGHKLYAPKGVGALYVRGGVELAPLLFGGRHENGRRPGTEDVAGAAALARACHWFVEHGAAERERLAALRARLEAGCGGRVNSAGAVRTPNTSSLTFDGISAEPLLIALDLAGFAVSSGAACSSGAVHASHVLLAQGLTEAEARGTIRVSLGRANDEAQVNAFLAALGAAVARLRALAP